MIDRDVTLLLIGGAIGLVSALMGALVQHFLSLRADRVRRKRDRKEKELERQREMLLAGADEVVTRQAIVYFGERGDFVGAEIKDVAGRDILIEEEEETQQEGEDEPAE